MQRVLCSILFLVCLTALGNFFVVAQENPSDRLFKICVNRKHGFIDQTGKVVIEPKFDGVDDFSEGLAKIYMVGKYSTGYIDRTGEIVIQPQFDIGSDFYEGFAWVGFDPEKTTFKIGSSSQGTHSFNYNIGFIDKAGKFITETIFKYAGDFSEGLAFVKTKENKYGFIDKTGKFAIKPKFDWASDFSEGLALVLTNNKYGFIDKSGNFVIEPQFTSAEDFSEGLAVVKIGGQLRQPNYMGHITTTIADSNYIYIDKTGKIILRIKAEEAHSFSDGLARFEMYGDYRHGFIDRSGKTVIQPKFSGSSDFSDGLASVILEDGGFGWINKTGEIILKSAFPYADNFKNGLARVADDIQLYNAGYGYIDKTGKLIWEPTK